MTTFGTNLEQIWNQTHPVACARTHREYKQEHEGFHYIAKISPGLKITTELVSFFVFFTIRICNSNSRDVL